MSQPLGHFEKVRALAVGPRLLAVGGTRAPRTALHSGAASQIALFDHVANKPVRTVEVPAHVVGLAFARELLAAACSDGALRLYDLATGAEVASNQAHAGSVTAVVAAPEGDRLATIGSDGVLRLFRLDVATASASAGASASASASASVSAPAKPGSPAPASSVSLTPLGAYPLSSPLRAVAFDPSGAAVAAAGDDGIVRAITLATGARRDMPGHDGPVTSLAFTVRDGRLASGGDDGTVRLWYLVGEVEHEVRGADASGHTGAVNALLCLAPHAVHGGQGADDEGGERLLSAGADGRLRVWRLEDRRKPRTLETSALPLHALAFAPAPGAGRKGGSRSQAAKDKDVLGAVFAAGDRRVVWRFQVDASATPADTAAELEDGFAALTQALGGARPARETAVRTLAALDEPEALEAALRVLRSDKDAEVRALAARELGAHARRGARAKLSEALDDDHATVRSAALDALCAIDRDTPLAPLRAGLEARAADVRRRALVGIAALHGSSPLVPGLLADRLADRDASVRLTALAELSKLHPGRPEPLRTAFERGPADLRIEVLVQAALAGWLSTETLAPIAGRALDDADPEVRRVAFTARVMERRALAHVLEGRDDDLARAIRDVARRAAQIRKRPASPAAGATGSAPAPSTEAAQGKVTDEEILAARAAIAGGVGVGDQSAALAEADLEPLLTAMACRTPDTAVRGARGLATLGDTRALGALLQLTREEDPALRRQAAAALSELSDTRAEKRLVWMLDDADASVRAAALDAYDRLEKAAPLPIAEASLRSSHEDIRVRGLDRLVKLAAAPEAEALLADAIEDESPRVRSEAFRTLWSWHTKDPQKALDRALAARFPDLRLRAVEELKARGEQPWAAERLHATIGDRDPAVARAAYDVVVKLRGKAAAEPHLAAMASIHPQVREGGARGAAQVTAVEPVRSALVKLLEDEHAGPRTAAIEALDRLLPAEAGPLHVGLQSSHLDLRVRAAELCAVRHDEQLVQPMRALLADKLLFRDLPIQVLGPLRRRAATALATLGATRLCRYFAAELLKDEHGDVREQAARGLAMAARRGDEGYLLDAMGHVDVAVRSWAADGLARLGDVRALPVLTGTLRHEHGPIRVASIMSFAALGPEGYGGMLQGLEDPSREVQEIVFAIVLARDLRAFRRGESPDLLTSALSSQRADVRFAAARSIELRTDPEAYLAHLIEVLTPPSQPLTQADRERGAGAASRDDGAAEAEAGDAVPADPASTANDPAGARATPKGWPPEVARGRLLVGLAEALASDNPEQRFAAAQVLRLRRKPLEYFREAKRAAGLRPAGAPIVADTTPRGAEDTDTVPANGWLRRLFARGQDSTTTGSADAAPAKAAGEAAPQGRVGGLLRRLFASPARVDGAQAREAAAEVPATEQRRLRWLAFGAYTGLLRQVTPGNDDGSSVENHRVRRDAIDRIVDLCANGHVSTTAALPPLVRALDDPNHLVRRAAFAGLKALFPPGAREPLSLGLASASADVARAALDELAARGDGGEGGSAEQRPEIARALSSPLPDVRRYAFELLERLSPEGSLDPLLAALGSEHADLRLGVLERLATSSDARIIPALCRAMESDHDDLRLRAAELLARRRDDRAVEVLAAFLRADQPGPTQAAQASAARARDALVALATGAAVRALAVRMEEAETPQGRASLARALGGTRNPDALDALAARFDDEAAEARNAAFAAALEIAGGAFGSVEDREKRDAGRALRFLGPAAHARDPALRLAAARELDLGDGTAQNELLTGLFADRDVPTRVAAVTSYAKRVADKRAPVAPLEEVLRAGARELMLPAAEGVAASGLSAALRPLLLFVRAGEAGERERALLALGALGDPRAVGELEAVASGGGGGGGKDAQPDGGRGAASAVSHVGRGSASAVPSFVEPGMQAAATEALGRLAGAGRLADPELRRAVIDRVEQALSADAIDLREAAARGVRWIGGERARVLLEELVRAGDTPERLRAVAVIELGLLGDTAAEATLAGALDAHGIEIRSGARKALDKLFPLDRTRVELLAVGSDHDDIAAPAATWLATEADPTELLPRLASLKDEELRQRLTMGLLRRAPLPAAALASLLADERVTARRDAAWLIAAGADPVGAAAPDPRAAADRATLAAALAPAVQRARERWAAAHGDARDDEAAALRDTVWAAARVGVLEVAPALCAVLGGDGGEPAEVRREAARAAGTLTARIAASDPRVPGVIAALTAALRDMDGDVRTAAAASLAALAPDAAAKDAAATRPFDPVASDAIARRASTGALAALAATGPGRRLALPALITRGATGPLAALALGPGDDATRLDAIAALGRAGGDPAIEVLGALAFDKKAADLAIRKAAYRAYKRAKRKAAKDARARGVKPGDAGAGADTAAPRTANDGAPA